MIVTSWKLFYLAVGLCLISQVICMSLNALLEAKAWGAQSPGKHLFFWGSIFGEDQVLALTSN